MAKSATTFKKGDGRPRKKHGDIGEDKKVLKVLVEDALNGGWDRFKSELASLQGRDYVNSYLSLLEFGKPKLARTELSGQNNDPLKITFQEEIIHARNSD